MKNPGLEFGHLSPHPTLVQGRHGALYLSFTATDHNRPHQPPTNPPPPPSLPRSASTCSNPSSSHTTVGLALGQDAPNQQCSDDAGPGWDDVREYYREGSDYPVRSSDPAPPSRPAHLRLDLHLFGTPTRPTPFPPLTRCHPPTPPPPFERRNRRSCFRRTANAQSRSRGPAPRRHPRPPSSKARSSARPGRGGSAGSRSRTAGPRSRAARASGTWSTRTSCTATPLTGPTTAAGTATARMSTAPTAGGSGTTGTAGTPARSTAAAAGASSRSSRW